MRITRSRSLVVYIIASLLIAGLVFFGIEYFTDGNAWATSYINQHISSGGELTNAGKVLDRNGEILAQTVDGERVYNDDYDIRCAMLHVVGDDSSAISTAIQNSYKDELVGYNPITGLGLNGIFSDGNNITLTLDSDICAEAYNDLGNNDGAALLYNYKTGEVLCMVSTPSYDPNNPPEITEENEDEYDGVYLDSVLSSSLTPGSIFKIVTCAAAIENIPDIYDRTFYCDGSIDVDGDEITCMEHHGNIGFVDAMSESCNIVFGELAMEIGSEKMTEQAEQMGFNKDLYVDGIQLTQSHYESVGAPKVDLGWSGIGQYKDLTNPMYMGMLMGAIANGGIPVEPYMIERISTASGIPINEGYGKLGDRMLKTDTANQIKDIMRYTVKNNYSDSMFPGLTVCAKTGTGETGPDTQPNAWMVGFSLDDDAPLAFAVVVEDSGYGYSQAGPIAVDMMESGKQLLRNN